MIVYSTEAADQIAVAEQAIRSPQISFSWLGPAQAPAPICFAARPAGAVANAPGLPPLQNLTTSWSGAADEWTRGWHARQWDEGAFHAAKSAFKNVSVERSSRDTVLMLSADAEAGLQYSERVSTSFSTEMEFTVDRMRPGVIAAPLWTYDAKSGDEIDFEIVGLNGLQLNLHSGGRTLTPFIPKGYEGDLSGRRIRVGITAKLPEFVSFYVDGQEVLRVTRANAPGGQMITTPQQVLSTIWGYPKGAAWAGPYSSPPPGSEVLMRLHGFAYQVI